MSRFPGDENGGDASPSGKPRRRSTGRLYGARNYSKQMVTTLLDAVENTLPIEQDEWQNVSDQFNYQFSDNRQVKSIRRKFMDMVNDRKTTAANAPEEVRRAKALHVKIMNKRRQNPHLAGKDDLDDVSSDDDDEVGPSGHPGFNEHAHHLAQYSSSSHPAVPVVNPTSTSGTTSNADANTIPTSAPARNRLSRAGEEHLEPTNPLMIQMVKLLEQHHQQFAVGFQQQILDALQTIQRQNQEILDALHANKPVSSGKAGNKRSREGDDQEERA